MDNPIALAKIDTYSKVPKANNLLGEEGEAAF